MLLVAAGAAMDRALERAQARVRSKLSAQQRHQVRSVPLRSMCATLGRSVVTAAMGQADEFAGAWEALEGEFMAWGATAQDQALDVASRVASGLSAVERRDLKVRQARDLAEAWEWFQEALQSMAGAKLFDPNWKPDADQGEQALAATVPPGMIRQAIARAGGAQGLVTEDGGAWVVMRANGKTPAGGIATGELIMGALHDNGVATEAFRWVYGPALRHHPFEPHLRLDGVVFDNFDDEQLANHKSWPARDFYMPGDHAGCICDFEPVLVEADGSVVDDRG